MEALNFKKGTSHSDQLKRLKRVEGQIKGIIRMIETKRYCVDIITQLKASNSALKSVEKQVLMSHLNHCVSEAIQSKNKKRADEMMIEIQQLMKTVK